MNAADPTRTLPRFCTNPATPCIRFYAENGPSCITANRRRNFAKRLHEHGTLRHAAFGRFLRPRAVAERPHVPKRGVFRLFAWVAIVDLSTMGVYAPRPHRSGPKRPWIGAMDRFQAGLDWSGLGDYRKTAWHRQLHIFQYPFYYIEYGIALIGALQMWSNSKKAAIRP